MPLKTLILLLVIVLAAPAYAQDDAPPRLIAPTGPYAVGRTAYQWVDESRDEVHTPDESDQRELLVEVWYPAEPGGEPGVYLETPMADLFAEMFNLHNRRLHEVRANAVPGAPLANDQPTYPVLIFDPGFSAAPRQYTVLLEELASYGYVVFSTSHPYVTTLTVFPDDRVIEPLNANALMTLWAPDDVYTGEFEQVWVPDVVFMLDQIDGLNRDDPQALFTGRLDTTRLGMVGHSQGARTISEVCLLDQRCAAAVNLDGGWSTLVDLTFDRPYMMLLADDGVGSFADTFRYSLEALARDFYVLMIPKTNHNSFNDTAMFAVLVAPELAESSRLAVARQAVLDYRLYIRSFLDRYVQGQDVPLMDGPSEEYPEVFFLVRNEAISSPTAGAEPQTARLNAQQGSLETGTADIWIYSGQAGETLNLWLKADKPANDTSSEQRREYGLLDTLLVVRAPDGSLLAANDDSKQGTDSEILELELPAGGEYQIEVRSWGSQTGGGYTLVIEQADVQP